MIFTETKNLIENIYRVFKIIKEVESRKEYSTSAHLGEYFSFVRIDSIKDYGLYSFHNNVVFDFTKKNEYTIKNIENTNCYLSISKHILDMSDEDVLKFTEEALKQPCYKSDEIELSEDLNVDNLIKEHNNRIKDVKEYLDVMIKQNKNFQEEIEKIKNI